MDSGLITAIATVVVAAIAYLGGRENGKAAKSNANAVDVETLQRLVNDSIQKHKTIIELQNKVEEITDKLDKLEQKNTVLWQYVYALIDFIKRHKLIPPPPPRELDGDAKLMELLK